MGIWIGDPPHSEADCPGDHSLPDESDPQFRTAYCMLCPAEWVRDEQGRWQRVQRVAQQHH